MSILPASVEAYLQEAGFSVTEIAVLKKLLEEDALTLRELAAKTGKSTGVLDQAVKKLLTKGILSRETINDAPKFVLKSLNTVVAWMEEDMQTRQQMMMRRHQDFETFVRSLSVVKARPEMEYFEGIEGVKKAYMQLLNRGNDIVQYGPTLYLAEEDPLRDFRVQWFRERRNRGLFMRVITHDTVLGRRFHSRDAFEYRKTILVDDEAYPLSFEKIIIGDTIACFQLELERAVFVRYPEMAQEERSFFERLWNKKIQHARNVSQEADDVAEKAHQKAKNEAYMPVVDVPFATKALSQVREFFLSKKSIAILLGFGLLAAVLTYGMYMRDVTFNTKRIQDRALSIGATGALQFDSANLDEVRIPDDIHKPEYAKIIYQLNLIRSLNPGVRYAYIMRPTRDPSILEFVADADALNPYQKADLNNDGKIDEADELPSPGRPYNIRNFDAMQELFTTGTPTVDSHPETDQWGTFISGYGPIKDANGRIIALFGVDIESNIVQSLSTNMLVLALVYIGLFMLFILIRLMAFNRSLMREIVDILKPRRNLFLVTGGVALSVLLTGIFYWQGVKASIEEIRAKVMSIVTTGALQFDSDDLDQLHRMGDMELGVYDKVVRQLHDIRIRNKNIQYAYLIRPHPNTTTFEFIADADGYERDLTTQNDVNEDGMFDPSDEVGYPGLPYDISHIKILSEGTHYTVISTNKPYTDKWGTSLSGYAPIKAQSGDVAALLAIDVNARGIYIPTITTFIPIIVLVIAVLSYVLLWMPGIRQSLLYVLWKKVFIKRNMYRVALFLVLFYWVGFGWYLYSQHLIKEGIGKRLVSIASAAALEIESDDLALLRFAKDMERPEYQKIFQQLNNIRRLNPEIQYAYILRPATVDGIWAFVADADSNYYIPFNEWDYTGDEVVDEMDEVSPPGVLLSP